MNIRKIIILFAAFAFFSAMLGGYFYFSNAQKLALELEHGKAKDFIATQKVHLSAHIEAYQREAKLLAGHNTVQEAFVINDSSALSDANASLDYFQKTLGADVAYLMDRDGNTIASSNRNSAASFVGKNYGFRPYFQEAINGHPSVYLARGVTSDTRGIYCSYPVYGDNTEEPTGVAIIKNPIDFLTTESAKIGGNILILGDPNGVIFSSNRHDWLFQLLWEVSPAVLDQIKQSRQFDPGPWQWVGMVLQDEDHATDPEGNNYLLHREEINGLPGWQITYFHNLRDLSKAIYTPVLINTGLITVILLILTGLMLFFLYQHTNESINKQKVAKNALLESEERFRSLSESAFEGIVIHDKGVILEANELFAILFGYEIHEIINKNVTELAAPDSRDEITGEIQSGLDLPYEAVGLKKDGSTFLVELHGKPLPYKGHTRRVTAVKDITERKKIEQELLKIKKLEATTILAGGIAHDFNNLLTIITGYADMAQDEIEKDSPVREMLHQVLETSRQAKILTQKFLTLSDGYSPAIKTTSMHDLLRAAMVNVAKEEQLSGDILLPADLWLVQGDSDKVTQALQNIITNAGEAMDGKGLIRIRAENIDSLSGELASVIDQPGPKYIKISIEDSGAGIAPENISRVLDPYFSTKQRGTQKGMGLGLTLANAIIKKNNGYIRVKSTVDAGTTVTVYLPAAEDLA